MSPTKAILWRLKFNNNTKSYIKFDPGLRQSLGEAGILLFFGCLFQHCSVWNVVTSLIMVSTSWFHNLSYPWLQKGSGVSISWTLLQQALQHGNSNLVFVSYLRSTWSPLCELHYISGSNVLDDFLIVLSMAVWLQSLSTESRITTCSSYQEFSKPNTLGSPWSSSIPNCGTLIMIWCDLWTLLEGPTKARPNMILAATSESSFLLIYLSLPFSNDNYQWESISFDLV